MQGKTLKVMSVLLEVRGAFLKLLKSSYKRPALLNIYTFIDICASLASASKQSNRKTFESYLETFLNVQREKFSVYDLWAARSSVVHAYSPFGDHTARERGAKPIFYYTWPEKKEEVEALLRDRGYKDFTLVDIIEIKWVALEAFDNFYRRVEEDTGFEQLVQKNAEHLLSNLHFYRLEEELELIDQMRKMPS